MSNALPEGLGAVLEENIISLVETPRGGLLTIGIIGTLWSASVGINAFIKSANEAYEVEEKFHHRSTDCTWTDCRHDPCNYCRNFGAGIR